VTLGVDPTRYACFLTESLAQLAALPVRASYRFAALDAALEAGFAGGRPGIGVELGVWRGRSLRRAAARHPGRRFVGFDSLAGFPEDGRPDWRLDFRVDRAPRLPPNATLRVGWFEDTLPAFAAATTEPVAVLNVDCDIHSAARTGLFALRGHLAPGSALHLDEALNYRSWPWNEMLALFAFLEATGFGVRWIARLGHVRGLAATLALLEAGRYPDWTDDVGRGFHREAALVLTPRAEAMDALEDRARRAEFAHLGGRLAAAHAVHLAGGPMTEACDPLDPARPAPRLGRWRSWLRWRP